MNTEPITPHTVAQWIAASVWTITIIMVALQLSDWWRGRKR